MNSPDENRNRVIKILRDPETRRRWLFTSRSHCAMAIIDSIANRRNRRMNVQEIAEFIGLPPKRIPQLFGIWPWGGFYYGKFSRRSVTPEMVADALERAA
jgi:hypothetical protein